MVLEIGFAVAAGLGVYAVYKVAKPKVIALKEDAQRSVANTEATVEAVVTKVETQVTAFEDKTKAQVTGTVTDVEKKL